MGRRSDGDLIGIIDRARYAQAESTVTNALSGGCRGSAKRLLGWVCASSWLRVDGMPDASPGEQGPVLRGATPPHDELAWPIITPCGEGRAGARSRFGRSRAGAANAKSVAYGSGWWRPASSSFC